MALPRSRNFIAVPVCAYYVDSHVTVHTCIRRGVSLCGLAVTGLSSIGQHVPQRHHATFKVNHLLLLFSEDNLRIDFAYYFTRRVSFLHGPFIAYSIRFFVSPMHHPPSRIT